MPYYNKHNNKLNCILNEEMKAKEDLNRLQNNCKLNSSKVCDFQTIFLRNKLNTLHHKIKDIIMGNQNDDNTIA
ncbi:MAG: hypothetical protein IJ848_01440 [Alphaproteobacteria bacterium]|nr:hypothetical protein [Alphaproteobacteria bacterium]